MMTDERDLARSLRTLDSPPGLTLDPDEALGRAHRSERRRRAGRGALATGGVAAVAATALLATGTAVGPIAVLPAAPWTDGCQGIVESFGGTSINLDRVSYAEFPLPGTTSGSSVVAFDACGGEEGSVASAIRGGDGQLGAVEGWAEPDGTTLQALRDGQTEMAQPLRTSTGESQSDAEETLTEAGFDVTGGGTEPLVAQSRDGLWHIWFGDEQATMAGELGSWLSVEFLAGKGREVVAYLPEGAEVEVMTRRGDESAGAEIRDAEPEVADGRFAWVSAPQESEVAWIGSDGAREVLEAGAP